MTFSTWVCFLLCALQHKFQLFLLWTFSQGHSVTTSVPFKTRVSWGRSPLLSPVYSVFWINYLAITSCCRREKENQKAYIRLLTKTGPIEGSSKTDKVVIFKRKLTTVITRCFNCIVTTSGKSCWLWLSLRCP